jgi:hypothetical protein
MINLDYLFLINILNKKKWTVILLVPTRLAAFSVSNVARLSPSTRSVTAANNICKSLDVFNKHNISLYDAFPFN